MAVLNPLLQDYFDDPGFLVLDGGLATELEARGHDLNHPLWSARLLSENPEAVLDVHLTYLEAGADCLITSSYQASFEGFAGAGFTREAATQLLQRSVELALQARKRFLASSASTRRFPLVAASVGPYGAALADGSEYHGDYQISRNQLLDFHTERWQILEAIGADLLACETIPSALAAEALLELIRASPDMPVWVSFSCADATHIRDGTPVSQVAQLFGSCPNVVAVGINCTAPHLIPKLIDSVKKAVPEKPIVVYPNSGETYDAGSKAWRGIGRQSSCQAWATATRHWFKCGARIIGGCCRTGPEHTRATCRALAGRG